LREAVKSGDKVAVRDARKDLKGDLKERNADKRDLHKDVRERRQDVRRAVRRR